MLFTRLRACVLCIGLTVLTAGFAFAQNYPSRPIRIVAGDSGGANDFQTRLLAPGLGDALGQQVIVENRVGNLVIQVDALTKAAPDGYTFLAAGNTLWLLPYLQENAPYDPVKDLAPVCLATIAPAILVVNPAFAAKSVQELIALAKANPGVYNYASGNAGSTPHLAGELFNATAHVNTVRVPYKGPAAALTGLIQGDAQMMFATPGSVVSNIKSGRLKALAVTSAQPSALFPGLPTVAASGLPGYEITTMSGYFARANTPPAAIDRVEQEMIKLLKNADLRDKFLASGLEAVGVPHAEFAAMIKSDMSRLGKVIKDNGIRGE